MADKPDNNDFANMDDFAKSHRVVIKSLINKDLHYDNKEAIEINNGFGKQVNYMKTKMEGYKLMKIKPTKKDLNL
tara:strand:+ start:797 stop:1021 length:225 start_codon:yes stop_codon:yes gene_type:complete